MSKKNQEWTRDNGDVVSLGDPRLAVVRHVGWVMPRITNYPDSTWHSGIEPDNFTDAILYKKPCFIEGIKNQIWFKDKLHSGWTSLYYIADNEREIYSNWLKENEYWAVWQGTDIPKPRTKISSISLQTNDVNRKYNRSRIYEERLFDQGYFERLMSRGVTKEYISVKIGVARNLSTTEIEVNLEEEV